MRVLKGWECHISDDTHSLTVRPGDRLCFEDEDGKTYHGIIYPELTFRRSKYIYIMVMKENDIYAEELKDVPLIDLIRGSINKNAKDIEDYTIDYREIYKLLSDDNKILKKGDLCIFKNITGFNVKCIIENIYYRSNGFSSVDLRIRHLKRSSVMRIIGLPTDEYFIISCEI